MIFAPEQGSFDSWAPEKWQISRTLSEWDPYCLYLLRIINSKGCVYMNVCGKHLALGSHTGSKWILPPAHCDSPNLNLTADDFGFILAPLKGSYSLLATYCNDHILANWFKGASHETFESCTAYFNEKYHEKQSAVCQNMNLQEMNGCFVAPWILSEEIPSDAETPAAAMPTHVLFSHQNDPRVKVTAKVLSNPGHFLG